jgi:hypothetical protein
MTASRASAGSALASVQRFMNRRRRGPRCELCGAELGEEHAHVVELATRRLCCACQACALLFSDPAAGKYRRVPRRAELVRDFRMTDVQWQGLDLPINLAFFATSSLARRVVAFYPSPAGATEALPPPDAWQAVVEGNPSLASLSPDVEALLVNRLGAEAEHYYVGIDECYALVGLVRVRWRGMTGGPALWEEVHRFFANLGERSGTVGGCAHA